MNYRTVREFCLQKWLSATKRERDGVREWFNDSLECKWQKRAKQSDFGHVSIFCGIGRFNQNITDILTDERFDHLSFVDTDDKAIIFRQYCKLGLIISESLTDFQDVMINAAKLNTKRSRSAISKSTSGDSVDSMIGYCNVIFKHKSKGIYKCDHHTTLCFDDVGRDCCLGNVLDIQCHSKQKCEEEIDTIVVPKLDEMIERVIQAYEKLDNFFDNNPDAFKRICTKYSNKKITN